MKLNKDTFNPKLHKVTLRGKSVDILGFSLDSNYAFFYEGELRADLVDKFEVTEVKRFRVGLFSFDEVVTTTSQEQGDKWEADKDFVKWLTGWTEF